MSEPIGGLYLESEEIVVKPEPVDYEDEDARATPSPEPMWKPIKIESILNNKEYSEEEEDEEETECWTKPVIDIKIANRIKKECPQNPKKVKTKQTLKKIAKPAKIVKKKRPKPKPEELGDEFQCSKCSKRCVNLAGLSAHYYKCGIKKEKYLNIVQSPQGLYCHDCGKDFKDIRGAKAHSAHCLSRKKENELYPPEETQYTCDICGLEFRLKSRIKQHMIIEHAADSLFTCDVCGKRNAMKSIHEIHMRTHMDNKDRPFPCSQCTKNFKAKSELQKHIYGVHVPAEDKPSFPCDECEFVTHKQEFLYKHKINKHMPDNEKPYQCADCGKGFMTETELERHVKSHTNQRIHSCPGCERMFKTNAEMKEHYVKDHTKEKPFLCEVCQHRTNHRHSYRRHLRKHERELGVKLDKSVRKFNLRLEDYLPKEQLKRFKNH